MDRMVPKILDEGLFYIQELLLKMVIQKKWIRDFLKEFWDKPPIPTIQG